MSWCAQEVATNNKMVARKVLVRCFLTLRGSSCRAGLTVGCEARTVIGCMVAVAGAFGCAVIAEGWKAAVIFMAVAGAVGCAVMAKELEAAVGVTAGAGVAGCVVMAAGGGSAGTLAVGAVGVGDGVAVGSSAVGAGSEAL